ncbi:MAG: amino acid permease [Pseudomonadota bacterium]
MSRQLFARKPFKLLMEEMAGENRLRRILGPVALSSLGIGAIIGTGIFVLTGITAHDKTGPALALSFVAAGITCLFAALSYAELASMVPIAGSAYTYAYATRGELFAWIIGWDLILEYAVGAGTVAHGWSHYFQDFISLLGIQVPNALSKAPFDFNPELGRLVATGTVFDLPAVLIAFAITAILVKGIKESVRFNAVIVMIKLAIVLFVIAVGAFFVNPANWHPFAPFGYSGISFFGHTILGQTAVGGEPLGMLAGAAIIFFAYIGFDSVSTHSEEAKNPQRDVPIGIISSLLICTVLYIAVSLVLTGMVPYQEINIDAPVSRAFAQVGMPWAHYMIAFGALAGITSVLLVMMLSQARVFLAVARDGLLPKNFFAAVHEKFRTPWKSTIVTGIFVAILAGFLPLRILAEMVSIGTLFAFFITSGAVLIMRKTNPGAPRPFRAPWVPFTPIMGMATSLLLMFSLPAENWWRLFIWLGIGLAIYLFYGRKHSVMKHYLAREVPRAPADNEP